MPSLEISPLACYHDYSEDNSFISKMLIFPYERSVQEHTEDSMTVTENWQLM